METKPDAHVQMVNDWTSMEKLVTEQTNLPWHCLWFANAVTEDTVETIQVVSAWKILAAPIAKMKSEGFPSLVIPELQQLLSRLF